MLPAMGRLHALVLRCSASAWASAALWLATVATLALLLHLGAEFAAVTAGAEPLDLQDGLDAEDALAQVARYSSASRRLYALFAALDVVFPLVGGLATASAAAFLARRAWPSAAAWLTARGGFLLLLAPTLFDWLENAAALILVFGAARSAPALALVAFKQGKLATLQATWVVLATLAVVAGVRAARARWRGAA